ncbi:MAG: site-specific integrase [Planctomycetes bacterium]|nr:site-specific integrase [Planctomycetota bacterium]
MFGKDLPAAKKSKKKRQGRRARGSGTIFYCETRQRWVGRKIIGRTAKGKPKYAERSGETQAAVVAALAAAVPPGPGTTVSDWGARWLASITVRPGTLESYSQSINGHIAPTLGGLRIADVTPSQVATLLKSLLASGLAGGSVANVRAHGRSCFEAAKVDGLIVSNPFSLSKRPKYEPKKIDPFTTTELKAIIADIASLSAGPIITLLAVAGCRLGEASALDVADWDPTKNTIAITKTYSKRFGVGPPKSKFSRRTIHVPAARKAILAAIGERKSGPLFVTGKGNRFIKSLIARALKRCLTRVKLANRNAHQLRHTAATLFIAKGVPLADVAKYIGDSLATLVKVYVHASGADVGSEMVSILS